MNISYVCSVGFHFNSKSVHITDLINKAFKPCIVHDIRWKWEEFCTENRLYQAVRENILNVAVDRPNVYSHPIHYYLLTVVEPSLPSSVKLF